jgi:zinc/manganese transport system permease protein
MTLTALDPSILLPPLLAGLVVLATHVPLGQQVLRRGIVFIDLAIAQIAGLGVIAAHAMGWEAAGWRVQAAALTAALVGAATFRFTEKRWPKRQEALIGSAFVLTASLGILLLSGDPHAGEQLKDLLVGQILWVNYKDLLPLAMLSAVVLALWLGLRLGERPLGFYIAFAVMITASVQVVGVYLVFASLILPALASPKRPAAAWLIGAAGYALGLLASGLYDLPAGAAIVCAVALCCIAAAFLTGRQLTTDT